MLNEKNKTSVNNGIAPTIMITALIISVSMMAMADIKQCENQKAIIKNQQTIISEISKIENENVCNTNEFVKEVPIAKTCIVEIPEPEQEIEIQLEVPDCDTSFKAYMDYNCITDDTTAQWELQQIAYTDEYGLRKIGTDYCVAVGSYYSETVGERFKITLDNDSEFTVIISDLKKDEHTDSSNRYSPVYDENGEFYSANVLEFIVDTDQLHSMVTTLGTVSYYNEFEGNIVSIEKIN